MHRTVKFVSDLKSGVPNVTALFTRILFMM